MYDSGLAALYLKLPQTCRRDKWLSCAQKSWRKKIEKKMMSFVGFASRSWSFENFEEGHVFILLLRWCVDVVVFVVMLSWLS